MDNTLVLLLVCMFPLVIHLACGKIDFFKLLFLSCRFLCISPRAAQCLCASLSPLVAPSQCSKLGSHLNTLLDHYQQFQEVAESLRTWLQESEAALGKLLSETVSSDLAVLQKQLASTKVHLRDFLGSAGAWVRIWLL